MQVVVDYIMSQREVSKTAYWLIIRANVFGVD